MSERKYKLEITETQAEVMRNALEFYSRIHMGQLDNVADLMPRHRRSPSVDYYLKLKDKLRELEPLFTGLPSPSYSYGITNEEISNDARIAWDLYQVIRYRLAWDRNPNPEGVERWNVHYNPYLPCDSQTPKAEMEEIV